MTALVTVLRDDTMYALYILDDVALHMRWSVLFAVTFPWIKQCVFSINTASYTCLSIGALSVIHVLCTLGFRLGF
jgi:hypothetical protein